MKGPCVERIAEWSPGKRRNQTVHVRYALPVEFRMQIKALRLNFLRVSCFRADTLICSIVFAPLLGVRRRIPERGACVTLKFEKRIGRKQK